MRFSPTPEQQQLGDMVQRFLGEQYTFEARRRIVESPEGFSREIWAKLAELKDQLKRKACELMLPKPQERKLSSREIFMAARQSHVYDELMATSLQTGREMKGWPVMTVLRGKVIAEWGDGGKRPEITSKPFGRYLPRSLSS